MAVLCIDPGWGLVMAPVVTRIIHAIVTRPNPSRIVACLATHRLCRNLQRDADSLKVPGPQTEEVAMLRREGLPPSRFGTGQTAACAQLYESPRQTSRAPCVRQQAWRLRAAVFIGGAERW